MTVHLQFYTEDYFAQIEEYLISEDSLQITASPLKLLETAKVNKDYIPIVILDQDDRLLIGFFVFNLRQSTYLEIINRNCILLRGLSLDYRYIGQGLAKQAMQLVPQFVAQHYPLINEIILGVNENNEIARNLYSAVGYSAMGIRSLGRSGWQELLHFILKN
ncbi:GNAT family N-acetyltransferase [Arachidicoccus sp.]|uniref:GNAT family N-acetyltransferase n=1 Tax=Arachidicoccus sp. TaxID=1872624 RepID=UPI003D22D2CF